MEQKKERQMGCITFHADPDNSEVGIGSCTPFLQATILSHDQYQRNLSDWQEVYDETKQIIVRNNSYAYYNPKKDRDIVTTRYLSRFTILINFFNIDAPSQQATH